FHSRMWELPIADENAEAACRQVRAMHVRDAIDDCSNAERVVSPAPSLTGDRHASRRGPIDVRELVRFDAAIGPAAAREYADIGSDLLGNVHVHARTTSEATDLRRVRNRSGLGRLGQRLAVTSHAGPADESDDSDLARLSLQRVLMFQLVHDLVLLKVRVKIRTVRNQ